MVKISKNCELFQNKNLVWVTTSLSVSGLEKGIRNRFHSLSCDVDFFNMRLNSSLRIVLKIFSNGDFESLIWKVREVCTFHQSSGLHSFDVLTRPNLRHALINSNPAAKIQKVFFLDTVVRIPKFQELQRYQSHGKVVFDNW